MILAVDIGGDRRSYGFSLIMNNVKAKYGIIDYVPNKELSKIDVSRYPIILYCFMFVENYLHLIPSMKKMGLELDASKRPQIIIAGGSPISENPEPIADFIDVAIIGEGEWAIIEVIDIIIKHKGEKTSSLHEIYETVDCAYVPCFYSPRYNDRERVISDTGRIVPIRREDPSKTINIPGFYTRKKKGENRLVEYSVEYHRGCKRKCKFCSYSHLQSPYREIDKDVLQKQIDEIIAKDRIPDNKIILLQTNLFHVNLDVLQMLKVYDKLPNYSSACYADMFSRRGRKILKFIQSSGNMYMRFGIEDFTEEGRARIGKPAPDWMLINLPFLFSDRGYTIKFFFISSLPWQTVEQIHQFESVMLEMSKKLSYYITIDCFVTVLNYKLNTDLLEYEKKFNKEVYKYLKHGIRRRYGKLQLKIYKNQDEWGFLETNILSLGNRKIGKVLVDISSKRYDRKTFVDKAYRVSNIDGLLLPYKKDEKLPNWYIDYKKKN